ncbi:deaminase [Citricoccus sp. SGAir0253]|uniref:dihydrofolate reductase family protein n=1 Tax=Citricoccus sp. SGAir0253 TaxID=2567881 RepID=UPI0010CCB3D1|nr:dihydrofolate reductase family protein [Citricoccus sp. SGAir0253]QCU77636.1 deaminase [Citricoccus sp. SGAir0253]
MTDNPSTAPGLLVDFITTLDGYASGEGWPGFWGIESPEYLAWLEEDAQRGYTLLLGARTYRLMSSMSAEAASGTAEYSDTEAAALTGLDAVPKVVFSSTLEEPLAWPNTTLVRGDAVEAVAAMKRTATGPLSTLGSLSLARSLLTAGLVDRFRVVLFPFITGVTGSERIYDGYPDVALELVQSRTFDGRTHLLEYVPTVLSPRAGSRA